MLNVCAQTILSDTLKLNAQVHFCCDVYVDLHGTYIYTYPSFIRTRRSYESQTTPCGITKWCIYR